MLLPGVWTKPGGDGDWREDVMDRVHVLDCTLRDGGYCNGWEFGYGNVKKIIGGLLARQTHE